MSKQIKTNAAHPTRGQLYAMGELLFLAMRSAGFGKIPMNRFYDLLQPAIDAQQFQVFRFDDVPRGGILWAKLSLDAERRYLRGETLKPEDWTSGDRAWIIHFLAPYPKMSMFMIRCIKQGRNLPARNFHYLRLNGGWDDYRTIVNVNLDAPKGARIRAIEPSKFLQEHGHTKAIA